LEAEKAQRREADGRVKQSLVDTVGKLERNLEVSLAARWHPCRNFR
jgi:hypothetical protein